MQLSSLSDHPACEVRWLCLKRPPHHSRHTSGSSAYWSRQKGFLNLRHPQIKMWTVVAHGAIACCDKLRWAQRPALASRAEQKKVRMRLGHSKPATALPRLTALLTLLPRMHYDDGQSENSCSAKTTCIFTEKSAFAPEKFDPARHRYRGNCPYKPIQKTVLIQVVFVPVLWVPTIPFKSILRIHPAQLSRPGNQQALWQPETASGRLQPQTMSDKILGSNNPTLRFQKIRWLDAFCLAGAPGHEGAEGS